MMLCLHDVLMSCKYVSSLFDFISHIFLKPSWQAMTLHELLQMLYSCFFLTMTLCLACHPEPGGFIAVPLLGGKGQTVHPMAQPKLNYPFPPSPTNCLFPLPHKILFPFPLMKCPFPLLVPLPLMSCLISIHLHDMPNLPPLI